MANVSVVPSFSFQPDELFLGIENGNLISSTAELVEIELPTGNRIQFEGTDLAFDFYAPTPWLGGTVTAVRLVGPTSDALVDITDVSVDAVSLNAVLTADPNDLEYSLNVVRFLLSGDDTFEGGDELDVIYTGLGDDSISAGGGEDLIYAGPGAATIDGGEGSDWINFAEGLGVYPATDNGVSIDLSQGTGTNTDGETLVISSVENVIGSLGNDTIVGNDDDNRLFGSDGDDSLSGGGGNDLFIGGAGNDTMDGGAGDDSFTIGEMYFNDVVPGDKVLIGGEGVDTAFLTGFLSDYDYRFDDAGQLVFTHKAAGVTYSLSGIETIELDGMGLHSVDDFRPVSLVGQSVNEDNVWTFKLPEASYRAGTTFTVTDLNGNQLPAWLTFDAATETFTGTPPANFHGTIGIKVEANDNGIPKTSTFSLNVQSVNDAPTDLALSGGSVLENSANGTVVGYLGAGDVEGDALSYGIVDGAGGRFSVSGNQLVVADGAKLDYEQGRSHNVTVSVTDASGASTTQTFTISVGDVAKENVKGGTGNDAVKGGSGNDKIGGGLGKDVLTGGKGKDAFVFNTKASKDNVDKITDFNVKDDQINLDNAVFSKLGKKGTESKPVKMSKDFFTIGTKAKDKNDYVVYDNKKGVLYYDADGSGKGKAVEIATLSNKAKLTADDFFVI